MPNSHDQQSIGHGIAATLLLVAALIIACCYGLVKSEEDGEPVDLWAPAGPTSSSTVQVHDNDISTDTRR